jgi:hypothetical protein
VTTSWNVVEPEQGVVRWLHATRAEFGEWLLATVALDAERRTHVDAIVRAKVRHSSDASKRELRAQLAVSEHLPDERRILGATTTAQHDPRAWNYSRRGNGADGSCGRRSR